MAKNIKRPKPFPFRFRKLSKKQIEKIANEARELRAKIQVELDQRMRVPAKDWQRRFGQAT